MKDYSFHKKVIDDVIVKLNELDIDLYLIITAEGCDPMTSFIPGVDTVGAGAFMFAKNGQKIATASKIDAQDTEESGLFDEVIRYEDYFETVSQMVLRYSPKRIALDFSEDNAFCDGLTMGKYKKFLDCLNGYEVEMVSADLFIPAVQEMNKK
jgi:hypothetical protein